MADFSVIDPGSIGLFSGLSPGLLHQSDVTG
jgi:hypothetical protein